MSASRKALAVKITTGLAALLMTLWAIFMLVLLSRGGNAYTFPHRFSHDIDSPVLAIELASERSDVDAALKRSDNDPAKIRAAERALHFNTVLDLVFIPLYTIYLVFLARLLGCSGKWVVAAIVGAGIFDYIEDACIFLTLSGAGPVPFVPSLIKWGLLALSFAIIGAGMLRGGATVYSFATQALLGIAHLAAAVLILVAVVLGRLIGYSTLQLGNEIFAVTVVVNLVGLLGPLVGSWFPGMDIVYVEDFCHKRKMGLTSGPAVRGTLAGEAAKN